MRPDSTFDLGFRLRFPLPNIRSQLDSHSSASFSLFCPLSIRLQIRWLDLMLFAFRLNKPHPDRLGTTIALLSEGRFIPGSEAAK